MEREKKKTEQEEESERRALNRYEGYLLNEFLTRFFLSIQSMLVPSIRYTFYSTIFRWKPENVLLQNCNGTLCMVQERIYIKCENQQAIRVESEKMSNDLLSTENLMRFFAERRNRYTYTPATRIH